MNIVLDTNVIFYILKARDVGGILNFINPEMSKFYISIVTEAEIKSLAIRNK